MNFFLFYALTKMNLIPNFSSLPRTNLQLLLFICLMTILIAFYTYSNISVDYLTIVSRPSEYFLSSAYRLNSSASDNLTHIQRTGYLVRSPSCYIPDIDPWHESIRHLIHRMELPVCSTLPPLTQVTGNTLQVVHANAHFYGPEDRLRCCYQEITRQDADTFGPKVDNLFSLSECLHFTAEVNLTSEQQFIIVRCVVSRWYWTDKKIYTNLHAVVPIRKDIQKKLKDSVTPERKRMSVLIVGIDSISRLNLIRTMPKTVNFLQSKGWLEMKGYNKVDYNTFPNLMAILTGLNYTQVRNTCMFTNNDPLDNCPFIWKGFSDQGYVTGYGEDEPTIGTFNFLKTGFYKKPTDYYLRPFMLAAENNVELKIKDNMNVCLGPTLSTEHVYKYATDFATVFRSNPYFALFWMNTLSHDDLNLPSVLDIRTLQFLQDLNKNEVLNNTFVVFLSDHGMRWGEIRKTYVGWLEERLPFIFIWVPNWYRKQFPNKYSNFLSNQEKLTSPFDLHLTLQEILYEKHDDGTPSCTSCVSMFDEVPWNRSCTDAGVTEQWCACSDNQSFLVAENSVQSIVNFAVGEINMLLKNGKDMVKSNMKCAKLSIKQVLSVRIKTYKHNSSYKEYVVQFETLPGEGQFEAIISCSGQFHLLGTISRINTYSSQSSCMNDPFLSNYCFCVRT